MKCCRRCRYYGCHHRTTSTGPSLVLLIALASSSLRVRLRLRFILNCILFLVIFSPIFYFLFRVEHFVVPIIAIGDRRVNKTGSLACNASMAFGCRFRYLPRVLFCFLSCFVLSPPALCFFTVCFLLPPLPLPLPLAIDFSTFPVSGGVVALTLGDILAPPARVG